MVSYISLSCTCTLSLAASFDCLLGSGYCMSACADIHLRTGGQRLSDLIRFLDGPWKWNHDLISLLSVWDYFTYPVKQAWTNLVFLYQSTVIRSRNRFREKTTTTKKTNTILKSKGLFHQWWQKHYLNKNCKNFILPTSKTFSKLENKFMVGVFL